ncbi:MAG: hypothetical protein IPQ07_18340 [Myxococcales bacterium]|nr:hypothetical protein [Myxococcales bacterium]
MRVPGVIVIALAASGCRFGFDALGEGPGDSSVDASVDGTSGPGHLDITVSGAGAVTGPGGVACAGSCGYDLPGAITLTAQAGQGWQLDHFSAPCGTQPTCTVDAATAVTATFVPAPIVANRVFVSSGVAPATGLAANDTFCNQAATAAGIGGTYVAFLSTTTIDARSRLTGSRGWVRVDGLPVVDLPTALNDPSLARPVLLDENGAPFSGFVNTGSNPDGTKLAAVCSNWTVSTGTGGGGMAEAAYPYVVSGASSNCGTGHVYCFETGKTAAVELHPPAFPVGRYVFVTSSLFASNTGRAAADAQCQADATSAGLPGSYVAMIATSTESVTTHVGSLSGIWRRPDGIVVTRKGLDQPPLDAAITMTADGTPSSPQLYYGAPSLTATSGPNDNCVNWSTSSGPGVVAYSYNVKLFGVAGVGTSICGGIFNLACAQLP